MIKIINGITINTIWSWFIINPDYNDSYYQIYDSRPCRYPNPKLILRDKQKIQ